MTERKWTPSHTAGNFLTKAEFYSYMSGFEEALDRTASHDLYEALEKLVECVEDGCYCSEMKMASAIDNARDALKGSYQ